MMQIPLTKGKVALVSDHRYEYVAQWRWAAIKSKRGGWYAYRWQGSRYNQKRIFMHNVIMPPPIGMEVDHKDRDGLNNQDENLRYCTQAQNQYNKGKRTDNASGYKGVSRHGNGWRAQLTRDGKHLFNKTFRTPEEAAHAYDQAAKKYFGEFANLNFPE